ncbi:hypothetical protein AAFN85_23090 [Mucilaginibacter sp. CAU 1740]|uniref:hypothetical protein n=1 Tax=Mucilaginibacter sp. CAU 1740 TaxID=3140365 RepID=UPI00325BAF8A
MTQFIIIAFNIFLYQSKAIFIYVSGAAASFRSRIQQLPASGTGCASAAFFLTALF